MKLSKRLNEYLLTNLLKRIANNELSEQEIQEYEALGIDEHARHFIMITNGSLKHFNQMYGNMSDELKEIDAICENLEVLATYNAINSHN